MLRIYSSWMLIWVLIPGIAGSLTGFKLLITSDSAVYYLTFPRLDYVDPIAADYSGSPNFITSDARNETVYWTDSLSETPAIYKSRLAVTSRVQPEVFLDTGILMPEGIAFDWISQNVYFADSMLRKIFVCSEKVEARCAVVIQEDIGNKPCGIALEPNGGIMFWTVFGKYPSIKTANMDGSLVQSVITIEIMRPAGIVIDYGKIYWTDIIKGTIESASFDGSNRQIHAKSPVSSGFDVYGDMLYWFDLNDSALKKQNKTATDLTNEIVLSHLERTMPHRVNSMNVMDVARQPIKRDKPSEHIECIQGVSTISGTGVQCLCSTGTTKHGSKCLDKAMSKLLVAVNNKLFGMPIDKIGKNAFDEIPLASEIKEISAMVYNPINRTIVISENTSRKIVEYDYTTKEVTVLVGKDIQDVISIDIDAVSENLIWLDAGKRTIEIMSIRTRARSYLMKNVDNAHQIASFRGTVYFTKTGQQGNEEIHKMSLREPNLDTLMYSLRNSTVKLDCDRQNGLITYAFINGDRLNLKSESADGEQICTKTFPGENVLDLERVDNQVFWIDEYENINVLDELVKGSTPRILKMNNISSANNKTRKLLAHIPGIDYLNYVNKERLAHACSPNSTHGISCPQICVPSETGYNGHCLCSPGFHLVYDYDYGLASCIVGEGESNHNNIGDFFEASNDDIQVDAGSYNATSDDTGDGATSETSGTTNSRIIWIIVAFALTVALFVSAAIYLVFFRGETKITQIIFPKPYVRQQEEYNL